MSVTTALAPVDLTETEEFVDFKVSAGPALLDPMLMLAAPVILSAVFAVSVLPPLIEIVPVASVLLVSTMEIAPSVEVMVAPLMEIAPPTVVVAVELRTMPLFPLMIPLAVIPAASLTVMIPPTFELPRLVTTLLVMVALPVVVLS